MPQHTTDIVVAASRCFHFNSHMLIPDYVVIHSNHHNAFAVTSFSNFLHHSAPGSNSDWELALRLSSEDILRLMGCIPPKPTEELTDNDPVIQQPPSQSPSEIREVANNARGPQDL